MGRKIVELESVRWVLSSNIGKDCLLCFERRREHYVPWFMSVKLGFVAGSWTRWLPGTMTFDNGPLGMLIQLQNNGLTMTGGKSAV